MAIRAQGAERLACAHAARIGVICPEIMELLLVLTLIASVATAGLLGLIVLRERISAREAREELGRGLNGFSQTLATQMSSIATVQNGQIEHIRRSVEESLARIQQDNSAKLEQMRQTVDEKLQSTLDKRLSESFKQVSERLELVHKGLGEMQTLATGVGDLKRVLTNVKTRGTWSEVQLGNLLEQILTAEQFARNVATKPNGREIVEYALKLPGPGEEGGRPVWLPIDAKFPKEDYERLVDAAERGDATAVAQAGKDLEVRVRSQARDI